MCSYEVYTRKEKTEGSTKAFDGEGELETFDSGSTLFHRESKAEACFGTPLQILILVLMLVRRICPRGKRVDSFLS
jgi:hypothetical protein